MGRPGIMIYFDILEPVQVLTNAERGQLLTAMLEYGKEGKEPAFTGRLALAWGFVRPKIDVDGERYDTVVEKRKYAGFCSSLSRKNLDMVSFEEWQGMDENQLKEMLACRDKSRQGSTDVDIRKPTSASNAITDTTTNPYTDAAADAEEDAALEAAAAEKKKLRKITGPLGQGVVNLSEEQIEMLLDRMDLDMFDYYVAKLANFILRSGAAVKNHYATILKWWKEDSGC